MNLNGKTVLITGAAKRVGREIAKGFACQGANVLIHYHRSQKEAEDLAREIRALKVESKIYSANLLKLEAIQKMTQTILQERTVDILVNNASLFYPTPLETTSEAQ